MKALIVIAIVLGLWATVMNFDYWVSAPSSQQEAQDVADDKRAALRQARAERKQQWIEAEMLKRGCKP